MTKTEYKYARKMIRENGARTAMRHLAGLWMYEDMKKLQGIQEQRDILAEREDVRIWCIRNNLRYNAKFDLLKVKK